MRNVTGPALVLVLVTGCSKAPADSSPSGGEQGDAGMAGATGGADAGSSGSSGAGTGNVSGGAGPVGGAPAAGGRAPLPGEDDCHHPEVTTSCADGWCEIPAGCFVMGSPVSEFGHSARGEDQVVVTISRAFEIMSHEVTLGDWEALMPPIVSSSAEAATAACHDAECPAGDVTFSEALDYANRLSTEAGLVPCYELADCTGEAGQGRACASLAVSGELLSCTGYRLPTDAEFEYAARAGTTTAFYAGPGEQHADALNCYAEPNLEPIAWYCMNFGGTTHAVSGKEPNAWGLFDMAGNVAELVNDAWTGRSQTGPLTDPFTFAASAELLTSRGGQALGSQRTCRSASHLPWVQASRSFGIGFRLVRTL